MLISAPPNAVVLLLMLSVLMRATRLRFDPRVDRVTSRPAGSACLFSQSKIGSISAETNVG